MWQKRNNQLHAQLTFNDFTEAFAFMTEVALIAEKQNHHPTWKNSGNIVDISLSTHDVGNIITAKDRQLADSIDRVYAKYASQKKVRA